MIQYVGLPDTPKLQDSDKVKTHLVNDFLSLSEFLSDFSAASHAVMYQPACKFGCKFNKFYHFKDNLDLEALLLAV